jgi:hypothetical protein
MTEPLEFFKVVFERYNLAAEQSSERNSQDYQIGNNKFRFTFATEALIPLITRALAHLEIPSTEKTDFEVFLWDSKSTGIPMVKRPWKDSDLSARGEVKTFSNNHIRTTFQPERNALSIINLNKNQAIYWVKNPESIPYFETGVPLLFILSQWLATRNMQVVHSGAVGLPEGGVLIAGKGGSGKSNSTLACLNSPLYFAADDFCVLEPGNSSMVYSIYQTGKVDADRLEHFQFLQTALYNQERLEDEKALFILSNGFEDRLIKSFPLKAILVPQITGKKNTSIKPAASGYGLRAVAPSTIFLLANQGRESLHKLANILNQVPCYTLFLGTELNQIPKAILTLLEQL